FWDRLFRGADCLASTAKSWVYGAWRLAAVHLFEGSLISVINMESFYFLVSLTTCGPRSWPDPTDRYLFARDPMRYSFRIQPFVSGYFAPATCLAKLASGRMYVESMCGCGRSLKHVRQQASVARYDGYLIIRNPRRSF
ncbi:unnamed protein product, partial [Ectocarpus fasciculatus]